MWLIINLHSHNFVHCVQIYHPILFNTTIPCLRQILPLSNSRRKETDLHCHWQWSPGWDRRSTSVSCTFPVWCPGTYARGSGAEDPTCVYPDTHTHAHTVQRRPQLADCPLILITDWCKWLPTALVGKIVLLVMTIRPFPQQLQNRLTLNLIFCICVGHYHGSLGIESQGYRLRVKVSKAGNVVSLTSDHWSQGS